MNPVENGRCFLTDTLNDLANFACTNICTSRDFYAFLVNSQAFLPVKKCYATGKKQSKIVEPCTDFGACKVSGKSI